MSLSEGRFLMIDTRVFVDRARAEGVNLVGPGGLLGGFTKQVLEAALGGGNVRASWS